MPETKPEETTLEKQSGNSDQPQEDRDVREGRKFAVSSNKGKAKGKVRYIETNDPSKGCRFL
ncbi:hypothetical protein P886_1700 [Alteromonadaceae bacterium 2753L.S.0a.02]|nr:hypothetical protein P886_1700 [Alteromonadaceae bacterium 2753L.S.0a.02]